MGEGFHGNRGEVTPEPLCQGEHRHRMRRGADFHRALIVRESRSEKYVFVQKGCYGFERTDHPPQFLKEHFPLLVLQTQRYLRGVSLTRVVEGDATPEVTVDQAGESEFPGRRARGQPHSRLQITDNKLEKSTHDKRVLRGQPGPSSSQRLFRFSELLGAGCPGLETDFPASQRISLWIIQLNLDRNGVCTVGIMDREGRYVTLVQDHLGKMLDVPPKLARQGKICRLKD